MTDAHVELVTLDGSPLTLAEVEAVARRSAPVSIDADARERIATSRKTLESALSEGDAIYGVNTGFGSLARKRVEGSALRDVQHNLVLSHAAGVGAPLDEDSVRAMLLLLAGSLCRGLSGVRLAVVEDVIGLLNAGVTPVVPSIGSVGASGDLAPLAHAALVPIGEGEAVAEGRVTSGRAALEKA